MELLYPDGGEPLELKQAPMANDTLAKVSQCLSQRQGQGARSQA